jgi:hypothetical protein
MLINYIFLLIRLLLLIIAHGFPMQECTEFITSAI